MYKAFGDIGDKNHSEFRINPKHAIGTTLLGPGLIFDLNRVVQTFHSKLFENICGIIRINNSINFIDKSSRFDQDTWSLNSLHNLYYLQYSLHMNDFIIIDRNEKKSKIFF